jgi:hypothetical protein
MPAVVPRTRGGPVRAELGPLDVLRQENEVLKQTIGEAKDAVQALEAELRSVGITVPNLGSNLGNALAPVNLCPLCLPACMPACLPACG